MHQVPARPATRILWGIPDYPENGFSPKLAGIAIRRIMDEIATETGETLPEIIVEVATGDWADELVRARLRLWRTRWSSGGAATISPDA